MMGREMFAVMLASAIIAWMVHARLADAAGTGEISLNVRFLLTTNGVLFALALSHRIVD